MSSVTPVDVLTGSRLHFGLICGTPETGWVFGGFAMMLRNPGWHLRLQAAASGPEIVCSDPAVTRKILDVLSRLRDRSGNDESGIRDACGIRHKSGVRIEVLRPSRLHAGLGAGTQLALAVARGLEVLFHAQAARSATELSNILGRGSRSAAETWGFVRGGCLVDYGVPTAGASDRTVLQLPVPDAWRFVVVWPGHGAGLSGDCEHSFFEQRRTMSASVVSELSDLIQNRLVPAVRREDFALYARSVEEYGRVIGQFYAPAQGNVFSHPGTGRLVARLWAAGIHGAAQSSWGPGICIPACSVAQAREIQSFIEHQPDVQDYELIVTEALNHGATIRSPAPETSGAVRA